jgi:hypothetical protein
MITNRIKAIMGEYVGKQLVFKIEEEVKRVVGDMDDDGENISIESCASSHSFILRNAYVDNNPYPGSFTECQRLKYFLVEAADGKTALLPLEYYYTPSISPGWSCTEITSRVKSVNDGVRDIAEITCYDIASVFDGYVSVQGRLGGHMNGLPEDTLSPSYPLLARDGCLYDKKEHTIQGSIERLIARLTPLWVSKVIVEKAEISPSGSKSTYKPENQTYFGSPKHELFDSGDDD